MTEATQTFTFDMEAELACHLVPGDFGVAGSSSEDIEDAQVISVWFQGTEYTRGCLIDWLGAYGAEKFMEKILDEAPIDEWEAE